MSHTPAHRPSEDFAARVLAWFDVHGRHDLPWQHPREPYRVWLSEIMLQQTQVATVIPYFERFIARFPDVAALAAADIDDVLALWAGLGYYARARNLHRCAQAVVTEHGGAFPQSVEALMALPGIGRSTAGAIASQSWNLREPILDGNVRRVLARHDAVAGWPGEPAVQKKLWALAEQRLPQTRMADYSQALMDLGATLCKARNPACVECPVSADCQAWRTDAVSQYPGARPRRNRPRRTARLILAFNDSGQLLLERRAPAGIWGGLWCPPLLDDAKLGTNPLAEQLITSANDREALPGVHHAFTHFDLELQPMRILAAMPLAVAEPGSQRWVTLSELHALGLPAPIRKLLDQLQTPTLP